MRITKTERENSPSLGNGARAHTHTHTHFWSNGDLPVCIGYLIGRMRFTDPLHCCFGIHVFIIFSLRPCVCVRFVPRIYPQKFRISEDKFQGIYLRSPGYSTTLGKSANRMFRTQPIPVADSFVLISAQASNALTMFNLHIAFPNSLSANRSISTKAVCPNGNKAKWKT